MNKSRILLLVAFMLVSTFACGQTESAPRNALVGAWKLVELNQQSADGSIHAVPSTGMFVFTDDGHVEVQVMELGPQTQTAGGPVQYSSNGYEASFGSYTVNKSTHSFTFHVEGAVARNLIGKDLQRRFEIHGNRLIIRSMRTDEHWQVVWEQF